MDETKKAVKYNDEMDDKFLNSRNEMEELDNEDDVATGAHAPYWPSVRFFLGPLGLPCSLTGTFRNVNPHGGSSSPTTSSTVSSYHLSKLPTCRTRTPMPNMNVTIDHTRSNSKLHKIWACSRGRFTWSRTRLLERMSPKISL